jgi:hypothetical protein
VFKQQMIVGRELELSSGADKRQVVLSIYGLSGFLFLLFRGAKQLVEE